MIQPEIIRYITKDNITLNMNFYRANHNRKNTSILYLHGGGLLYGSRDDLPEMYLEQYLNSGYNFLALEYPLAPESKLDVIISTIYEEISYYLINHKTVLGLERAKYILFGRSAGAYLCFMICNKLIQNKAPIPSAIISLYGYTRLDEIEFTTPNSYYNKLAKVTDESIQKIISNSPITYGPLNARFSLYVKARQEGTWINYICPNDNLAIYSLDDEALNKFPPTILAASTLDPDVPYKISKKLSKLIPDSNLITIYEDVHDFDRDMKKESGRLTYEKIILWLEQTIID